MQLPTHTLLSVGESTSRIRVTDKSESVLGAIGAARFRAKASGGRLEGRNESTAQYCA
ncbi:protein of unknown function (plasmid) [Pararobbsia alpina]